MKALLIPLVACAALAGCATYGDPYGYSYPAYSSGVTVYGGTGYGGYYGGAPAYQGGYSGRGMRDRDRDGIPNRMDRDRDNDGVPNRLDSRPNNPRRN